MASNIDKLDEEDDEIEINPPPVIDGYGGVSLHEQSHGESFLSLLVERFGGNGLYILDEPEAALSPLRQLAALGRMRELVNNHSQFIIATHSPIWMTYPGAVIYQIDGTGLTQVEYQDTEHYELTRAFLNNPEPFLKEIFSDTDSA